jgi:hypothetical protein
MSIRSWFSRRSKEADADAVRRAEEEALESPAEREHSEFDRWGEGADNRISGRIGEAGMDDVNRLGDFPR